MSRTKQLTVVETAGYLDRAEKVLTEDERDRVKWDLSLDPEAGTLLQETGGCRKIRIGVGNRGKSAGARVVYYFHDDGMPLFLFALFTKNEKANLSAAEKAALRKVVQQIKKGR